MAKDEPVLQPSLKLLPIGGGTAVGVTCTAEGVSDASFEVALGASFCMCNKVICHHISMKVSL